MNTITGGSWIFKSVGAQLDEGKSRSEIIIGENGYDGLASQMVLRTNPLTGTAIGAYNATEAFLEGRPSEFGAETTGVVMHF